MASITTSIDVDRPPKEAFAFVTDPTRFIEWQQEVVDGRMEDRCLTTRRNGFAERPVTSEVTPIDPPEAGESERSMGRFARP